MRAAVCNGARDIRIEQVPDPSVEPPTDAPVQITHACMCGSGLWPYRGIAPWEPGMRTGHEWMGIVTDVGAEVRTVSAGDRVLAPFTFSDGTCEFCSKGLPLTGVMSTGHHAVVSAGVVGDAGLCGVFAARRLGAEQIIALGHHGDRLQLATQMGATHVVDSGDPVAEVGELTKGGGPSVLECVGVPAGVDGVPLRKMFGITIALRGGVAPVRAYVDELLADALAGELDPSPVLDTTADLDGVPDGYAAMDERRSITVQVRL